MKYFSLSKQNGKWSLEIRPNGPNARYDSEARSVQVNGELLEEFFKDYQNTQNATKSR